MVWNGQELGGGSIRIHDAEVQQQVFAALGIDEETAEARFGFLLEALRYGAPPHGGIAYGIDRIVQQLRGAETIRDVIAFPKTASGLDPLTGAPAPVDELQLRELASRSTNGAKPGIEMGLRDWIPRRLRPGPGPGRRRSTSTTRASNAGRWCGTSAMCAPRAPGTRR